MTFPSFWQERVRQARELSHPFEFDATYGYDLEQLLAVEAVTEPEDFAEFWRQTYAETLAVDPEVKLTEIAYEEPGWRCFEVKYTSWRGFRVGGWLVVSSEGEVTSAFVFGHGYGGREAAPPSDLRPGSATLYPFARGFGASARPDLPGHSQEHVLHGIESREDYLIRGCVADLWASVSVLEGLYPGCPIFYYGGSFGGGLGALALPWERRFARAFLGYPTFGNHPLRVTLPCTGSGKAVRDYYLKDRSVLEVLRYYDASTAALRVTTPTFIAAGGFDPAVPPPGQFAVLNGLRATGAAHRYTVHTSFHFTSPFSDAEAALTLEEARQWFACGERSL